MSSIVEAKVADFLQNWLRYDPNDSGTVLEQIRALARVSGFELDERFARAGMAAGPEGRVASRIVGRALRRRGNGTTEYAMRKEIDAWLRGNTSKGRF